MSESEKWFRLGPEIPVEDLRLAPLPQLKPFKLTGKDDGLGPVQPGAYHWHYMRCPSCHIVFHFPGKEPKPQDCDVCKVPMEEW